MLDTVDLDHCVFRVNMVDALRTSVLRDGDTSSILVLPTLADFASDSTFNQIHSAAGFVGYLPIEEAPAPLQYSNTFANYFASSEEVQANSVERPALVEQFAREGRFTLIQVQPSAVSVGYFPVGECSNLPLPTVGWVISPNGDVIVRGATQREPLFDLSCDVVASALDVLAEYVAESDRNARESWKRLCRRNVRSSSVSKNGHLSPFAPSYTRVCVETAARDQVVHLEVINLAAEHEAPGASAVGQMKFSGGKSWMRMKSRLLNLLSGYLEKALRFGFIGGGFDFAIAEAV